MHDLPRGSRCGAGTVDIELRRRIRLFRIAQSDPEEWRVCERAAVEGRQSGDGVHTCSRLDAQCAGTRGQGQSACAGRRRHYKACTGDCGGLQRLVLE